MTSKSEAQDSRFDLLKWLAVVALVIVGVVGNQYYSASPILYRVIALLVLAAAAAFVALQTAKGRSFLRWLRKLVPRFVKLYGQPVKKPLRPPLS